MRSCQESASYLHSLGIKDGKLAEACGVGLAYMNTVRNGRRAGGPDLQAKLDSLCEQAIERGLPVVKSTKSPQKQRSIPASPVIVDAVPASGYSASQELILYSAQPIEEAAPKNRIAPHAVIPAPYILTPQEKRAIAFNNAARNFQTSLIPGSKTPASAPVPAPAYHEITSFSALTPAPLPAIAPAPDIIPIPTPASAPVLSERHNNEYLLPYLLPFLFLLLLPLLFQFKNQKSGLVNDNR